MDKHWTFQGSSKLFNSYDDAVAAGKRYIARPGYAGSIDQLFIMETVAVIKTPVPEYEVVKL